MLDEYLTSELYLCVTQLLALITAGCCVDILRTTTMNYELISEEPWTKDQGCQQPKRGGGGGKATLGHRVCCVWRSACVVLVLV